MPILIKGCAFLIALLASSLCSVPNAKAQAQAQEYSDYDEESRVRLLSRIEPASWQGVLPSEVDIEIRNEHPERTYTFYLGDSTDMSAVVRITDINRNRITKPPTVYDHDNPATFSEIELPPGESYTYSIDLRDWLLTNIDKSGLEAIKLNIGFLFAYQIAQPIPGGIRYIGFRIRTGLISPGNIQ